MEPAGFRALLSRAQNGDASAMEAVLEAADPYLRRVARSYADAGRAESSISDLVQEAKLRAWQRLRQFEGGSGDAETWAKFLAWMSTLVRRVGINAHEARNAAKRKAANGMLRIGPAGRGSGASAQAIDPAASASTPSAGLRRQEDAHAIRTIIDRVPTPSGRDLVRLCFFEGLTLREASERLGLTYPQARERYHVALKRLERDLARYLE